MNTNRTTAHRLFDISIGMVVAGLIGYLAVNRVEKARHRDFDAIMRLMVVMDQETAQHSAALGYAYGKAKATKEELKAAIDKIYTKP